MFGLAQSLIKLIWLQVKGGNVLKSKNKLTSQSFSLPHTQFVVSSNHLDSPQDGLGENKDFGEAESRVEAEEATEGSLCSGLPR